MVRCIQPCASAEFSPVPLRYIPYHTVSCHHRISWRPYDNEDAWTWYGCKHWRCLVWCIVQRPSFLLKGAVAPKDDIWYNGTTQHLQFRHRSCTSDKTPRLGSYFVIHQCAVSIYTPKVTCLLIVRNNMHQTQSLLTSIMMSPCMKEILERRGLNMTDSISFYQRTVNIFLLIFFGR